MPGDLSKGDIRIVDKLILRTVIVPFLTTSICKPILNGDG